MTNSMPAICMVILLCCLNISQANDCGPKPSRCPFKQCYCPGKQIELFCKNGKWSPKPCDATDIPTTIITLPPTTPETTCESINTDAYFTTLPHYTPRRTNGYPVNTSAQYKCKNSESSKSSLCKESGEWSPKPVCSCKRPRKAPPDQYIKFSDDGRSERYPFGTTATYHCRNKNSLTRTVKCSEEGSWIKLHKDVQVECTVKQPTQPPVRKTTTANKSPTTHHNEERTVVIVSGTTGAILGALIILVVIVSCQRRLHYHRVRRARLRHRQDQEAFTAFITYHRDVRLMLPSYDEAMNQEHTQPPSFAEAVRDAGSTLSHGDTHTPSVSTDSPTSSNPPGNETCNSPENSSLTENDSDTAHLIHTQSSENSRFFRSLRALFGGRAFRPDAIYCRFVPEENGRESPTRGEERESRENSTGDGEERESRNELTQEDLNDVLTQAGLC